MICQIDNTGKEKAGPQRGITETEPTGGYWGGGGKKKNNFHKSSGYSPAGSTARTQNKERSGGGGGWNSPPWEDEWRIWPITWSGFGATRAVCLCPLHIINTVWTHTTIQGKNANWFGQKSSVLERSEKAQVWKRPESPLQYSHVYIIHLSGAESLNREPLTPVKHIIAFYLFHLAFLSNRARFQRNVA